MFHLTYH